MKRIDIQKPAMELWEEGDWVRIVVQGHKDRFLKKDIATRIMYSIGSLAVNEKSDVIVRTKELIV
jgi:hypothetical protein